MIVIFLVHMVKNDSLLVKPKIDIFFCTGMSVYSIRIQSHFISPLTIPCRGPISKQLIRHWWDWRNFEQIMDAQIQRILDSATNCIKNWNVMTLNDCFQINEELPKAYWPCIVVGRIIVTESVCYHRPENCSNSTPQVPWVLLCMPSTRSTEI